MHRTAAAALGCLLLLAPAAPAADADAWREEQRERRLAAALDAGPDAVLLVLAAGPAPVGPGPRNPDFDHLASFDRVDCALVLAAEGGEGRPAVDRAYLPLPDPARSRWTGSTPAPGPEFGDRHAFGDGRPLGELTSDVAALLAHRSTLFVSAPRGAEGALRLRVLLLDLGATLGDRRLRIPEADLAAALPGLPAARADAEPGAGVEVRDARPLLGALREVKSPAEAARIRAACEATAEGLRAAMAAARPGVAERELAAHVEFRCRLAGCARQAFPSIVGSGPNSCVLHYDANGRTLRAGELVVCDVGGEYEGYAADVTRTLPVSGRFSAEQARVYDAVLAAQEAAIAAARPGATLRQVHAAARAELARRGLADRMLHATCHSVGLEVHDPFRPDAPLRAGCVIAIEPGVYLPELDLGVRIEDTVLISADGAEVLSAAAPRTRAEIESLMDR